MIKLLLATAAAALVAMPAAAVTVTTITTSGGNTATVAAAAPGQLSVDFGLSARTPITLNLVAETADLGFVNFDSVVDSFFTTVGNGNPLRSLTLTLSGGATFTGLGTVAPAFGSVFSAVLDESAARYELTFAPAETFGLELGDVGNGGDDFIFDITSIPAGGGFTLTLDATTVPEPASWALLVTGFGLAGASLRRRRRVVAA